MSLLLVAPGRDLSNLENTIRKLDPEVDVELWPEISNRERISFIVCWNHPEGLFKQFPNLKAVSSLGAGTDHLLSDDSLPSNIPVTRIVSPTLIRQMKEYVLGAILSYQRNLITYFQQKTDHVWELHPNKINDEIPVGIMGMGKIGKPVAEYVASAGYRVNGWSRTAKNLSAVKGFKESQLKEFLQSTRILVCLLPLTKQTNGILNLDLFKNLMHPAYLINVGRGEHLVEEDLVYALDKKWLDGAFLDVFSSEPLREQHPFWNRRNVMITPHIASITPPDEAAEQIIENYKRTISGMPLRNQASREKGY